MKINGMLGLSVETIKTVEIGRGAPIAHGLNRGL